MSAANDDDEEEIIIYAEFNGMLHEDILHEPNVAFKIIGFDGEHPIMQIGDEVYEGAYEDTMGTNVIFEEDTSPSTTDEVFAKEVPNPVQYLCKTNKILKMNRIFIAEKNPPSTSTSNEPAKFADTYDEALTKLSECYLNQHDDGPSISKNQPYDGPSTSKNLRNDGPSTSKNVRNDGPSTSKNVRNDGPSTSKNQYNDGPSTSKT